MKKALAIGVKAEIGGREWEVSCVSMGNPHCVVFTDAVAALDLEHLGPKFENAPLFPDANGKQWELKAFTEKAFYTALEEIGIDNPLVEIAGGVLRHKYTPHTCRHTFSTLLKRAAGAEKDKLALIGHTSGDMLRYYQDVQIEDIQAITDLI